MNCYAEPFLFNKNIQTHQAMPAPITRNIRIIGKSKKNRILFGCRFGYAQQLRMLAFLVSI